MKLSYNVTGIPRKSLVLAIEEILNAPLNYKGAPTFAYEVCGYIVDKNGTLTGADNLDLEAALHQKGFIASEHTYEEPDTYKSELSEMGTANTIPHTLTIELPLDEFTGEAISNLEKLVASKVTLIKKALDTNTLPIEVTEDKVSFPWFSPQGDAALVRAYTQFITALCTAAKEQKRVTAKEKIVDNEKFAFRVFLIRLGFVGDEYKAARKILLRNLSGNSAFKNGTPEKTNKNEETHR